MEGTRPKLPEMWTDPATNPTVKHPAAVGLIRAMEWCWTHDPELRPSAREVSDHLEKELQRLEFALLFLYQKFCVRCSVGLV